MKPKTNRIGKINKSQIFDCCQTPHYAIDPILPYLNSDWLIWEPASGEGQIARKLGRHGWRVRPTDILTGQNFFEFQLLVWDAIVTNPPYSIKYKWLARCYELDKPFALLLPLETLGAASAQKLFEIYGIEIILLNRRVNFRMPEKGYTGGGAQFPTAWFTWRLGIGSMLSYAKIRYYEDQQLWLPLLKPVEEQMELIAI